MTNPITSPRMISFGHFIGAHAIVAATTPLSPTDLPPRRRSLGLPLLLPPPLQGPSRPQPEIRVGPDPGPGPGPASAEAASAAPSVFGEAAVAIEPEQAPEQGEGPELDQPIA